MKACAGESDITVWNKDKQGKGYKETSRVRGCQTVASELRVMGEENGNI